MSWPQEVFQFFAEFFLLFAEDGSCNGTWAFGTWPLKHKLEEEHGLITAVSGAIIKHPTRARVIVLRGTIREWKYKNQCSGVDTKFSTSSKIFCQQSPDHGRRAADSQLSPKKHQKPLSPPCESGAGAPQVMEGSSSLGLGSSAILGIWILRLLSERGKP